MTFPVYSKFPDFSQTGKCLSIFQFEWETFSIYYQAIKTTISQNEFVPFALQTRDLSQTRLRLL